MIKKVISKTVPNLWKIIHKALATDSYEYAETIVEGKDAEDAMNFFNTKVADGDYIKTIHDINSVYPFTYITQSKGKKDGELSNKLQDVPEVLFFQNTKLQSKE